MAQQLQAEDEHLEKQAFAAYVKAQMEPQELPPLPNQAVDYAEYMRGGKAWRSVFSAKELVAQDVAIRRRVLREAYFGLAGAELDQERTLALEQLVLSGTGGKLVQLPGGVTARYVNKKLILEKQ